ncbi:uncharacterized protein EAE98_004510 [Botrytis deweyae]|uniref:Clr5 domain-containing protein n=1 Tax=Botrytis deweyae TaxID=2478750 RepID=A0ABQ7IRX5_9HELO|nr:uncharacterized protein EAE98_004510 [Botrytis deweyae]KAF7931774.1 hypothetical protein EAE98_004510 [Botrytis deweyae]
MVAKNPLTNWDPKFGRFHSIWSTQAGTEWASKYGVLPEIMDPTQLFFPYKKSALTPNALDNQQLKAERKNHQKWILSGYWPELLEEIGAYPYPLNYLPTLTNPIDPLFEINQWQPRHTLETWPVIQMEFPPHKPFFPVEPDNIGLDGFYFGDRTDVPERLDRRPAWQKLEQGPLKFFHKRDPQLRSNAQRAEKTEELKIIMRERVQFGIGPIVSKYYEFIHSDDFWDRMATNFGVSIIAPTPAPIVVIEPDPSRPELSIQRDNEVNKLRRVQYLHQRDNTERSVNECNNALERYFTQSPGELSDSEILRLLRCFADNLKREADQETQCAIDFMAEADLKTPSNVDFGQRLLNTNRVARKMVTKASADCDRVGVATLGTDFHEIRAKFDKTLYILRAINFILAQQVKPDKNETYEEVIDRVGNAMDYEGLERLQSSDAQNEILQAASQETILAQAMNAYQKHDYDECHRLGRVLLSQFDLEGYAQGIGMVLIAMHPGEIRRRWCSRQGLYVLNIMARTNATPFLELWVEVATQVHDSIEDLAVNAGIGDALCVLGID